MKHSILFISWLIMFVLSSEARSQCAIVTQVYNCNISSQSNSTCQPFLNGCTNNFQYFGPWTAQEIASAPPFGFGHHVSQNFGPMICYIQSGCYRQTFGNSVFCTLGPTLGVYGIANGGTLNYNAPCVNQPPAPPVVTPPIT